MGSLAAEIERVWAELIQRQGLHELRLTATGRIVGLDMIFDDARLIGVFDRTISLPDFRDAVYATWEELSRG